MLVVSLHLSSLQEEELSFHVQDLLRAVDVADEDGFIEVGHTDTDTHRHRHTGTHTDTQAHREWQLLSSNRFLPPSFRPSFTPFCPFLFNCSATTLRRDAGALCRATLSRLCPRASLLLRRSLAPQRPRARLEAPHRPRRRAFSKSSPSAANVEAPHATALLHTSTLLLLSCLFFFFFGLSACGFSSLFMGTLSFCLSSLFFSSLLVLLFDV